MNWLDKLELKIGRWAIKRLMYYIIFFNALVFLMFHIDRTILSTLTLIPGLVLKGELWRLISYIFIPPTFSPLWVVFTLYFYYLVGTGLENEWGSFKFNSKRQTNRHLAHKTRRCYNKLRNDVKNHKCKTKLNRSVKIEHKEYRSIFTAITLGADHARAKRQRTEHQSVLQKRRVS